MAQDVLDWFNSGASDIQVGMKLHTKYSKNNANKKFLATNPIQRKKFLPIYLGEILDRLMPNAYQAKKVEVVAEQPREIIRKIPISEKLKSEFPKLNFYELPDVLKLLVIERYQQNEIAKENYALQQSATDNESRLAYAEKTIAAVKKNWEIWDELNHYHMYNRVLGKHEAFSVSKFEQELKDLEQLPILDYTKELTRIRANRRTAINRMLRIQKEKALTDEQQKVLDVNISEFNIVSKKLKEEQWK